MQQKSELRTTCPDNNASASRASITGFRSRKGTHVSQSTNRTPVNASTTSLRIRMNKSVNHSVRSIRDGVHHSRRSKHFYPIEDLPRRKSIANHAIMLGSLSSVRPIRDDEPRGRKCFWDWGAPTVDAIRSRIGCVFVTAIVWNCMYAVMG